MVPPSIIRQIRDLLAEGKSSQRAIAKRLQVSRGTVASVASGRRPDYVPKTTEPDEPLGPLQRCPQCGGMVYMPCRLCKLRSQIADAPARPRPRHRYEEEGLLQLNLREHHRVRYVEVHRRRVALGEPVIASENLLQ